MTRTQFEAIVADIERQMYREPYWLVLHAGAQRHVGAWRWLDRSAGVLSIGVPDTPPTYLSVDSVTHIELSADDYELVNPKPASASPSRCGNPLEMLDYTPPGVGKSSAPDGIGALIARGLVHIDPPGIEAPTNHDSRE